MHSDSPPVLRRALILVSVLVLLCVFFPVIDLAIADLAFTPGEGFLVRGVWYERIAYHSVPYVLLALTGGLSVVWLRGRRSAGRDARLVTGRQLAFLLLLLAIGPGLLVNEGLKENWGRSRPVDLIRFGGDKSFSPAFVPSDQGGKSFPSGHAAAAFYTVAVALTVAGRRRPWAWLAFGYASFVGGMRIAVGAHFLSDVLASLLIVALVALLLHKILFGRAPAW
jgi:lipid A 4'-phosphatase